jgi:hypothetical protein
MSQETEESGVAGWKAVFALLGSGRSVEIPCADDSDFERRAAQVVKRAEKRGMTVEISRAEGRLRIDPRQEAQSEAPEDEAGEPRLTREQRQARRAQRQSEPRPT